MMLLRFGISVMQWISVKLLRISSLLRDGDPSDEFQQLQTAARRTIYRMTKTTTAPSSNRRDPRQPAVAGDEKQQQPTSNMSGKLQQQTTSTTV
ncbi:hypothetical protein H5410_001339 [Solanum commersonii]|uniref:Uncharacterized protein n=1 Tax=Solanum commersonii TaxID=4109 RepID=A0A9J6AYM8_SOLCO|nr:hypothetical protein H5410_001339 [Solanum commersonii]